MDHNEAVQQMAAERYLLDELAPDARGAFEEHLFDCPECALDLRAGAAFVDEAKAQLPALTEPLQWPGRLGTVPPKMKRDRWLAWWRPAFAAPVFAALLIVVGYQNVVTYPALRSAAKEPHLVAMTQLHGSTRGGTRPTVTADRKSGIAVPLDLPEEPVATAFVSYSFDLYDPEKKVAWTGTVVSPAGSEGGEQRLSLEIPGALLRNGSYTIAVSGVGPHGERTAIESYVFEVHLVD